MTQQQPSRFCVEVARRPISKLVRLRAGVADSQLDANISTPLRPQPARPYITARLLPLLSMMRLA